MKRSKPAIFFIKILLVAVLLTQFVRQSVALAQDQEGPTLSLRRDFGYSSGTGRIQGHFTASVQGPESLTRVVFLIDDQEIGTVTEAPFQLKFVTDDYPLGVHTLRAVGYTADGQELKSNEQRREFVPAEEGWKTAGKIVIPIFALIFVIMLASFVLPMVVGHGRHSNVPLGAPRSYGMLGGAICPKCGRPFGMHIWGLNMLAGKFDRCPHCGKWSLVSRASMEALHAAEAAEVESAKAEKTTPSEISEDEIRKELDDSRYQDL